MECFNIGCSFCNECDGNDPDCKIAIRENPNHSSEYAVEVWRNGSFDYQVDVYATENEARKCIEANPQYDGYYRIIKIVRDEDEREVDSYCIYDAAEEV